MTVRGVERLKELLAARAKFSPYDVQEIIRAEIELRHVALDLAPGLLAVYDAAAEVITFDLHACQYIDGLEHDGHALRAIHVEDCAAMIVAISALAAAVARVKEGEAS